MRTTNKALLLLVALAVAFLAFASCSDSGSGIDADDDECDTSVREEESGLEIRDITCGDGVEAESGDILIVHYVLKLEDGTVLESTSGGEPLPPFQLGAGMVIRGWDIGLEGMQQGGKRELTVPPELAYGAAGSPPDIPPNATLTFEIELLEVSKSEA